MPQFPIRQQQSALSGQGGQSFVDADAFGASVYRGIEKGISGAVQIMDARAQERAATEMASTRIEWAQRLQEAQQNPDAIGDDWNETVAEGYKQFVDEKAATMGHFEAQHYRKRALENMERVQLTALDIEARVTGERKVAAFSKIANDAQQMVVQRPTLDNYQAAWMAISEASSGATSDSTMRAKLEAQQQTKLFGVYADSVLQTGVEGARMLVEDIDGLPGSDGKRVSSFHPDVDAAALEQAKTRALRVIETDALAKRERLSSDVQEAIKLNSGGTFFDNEAYSLEGLTAVYGKDRAQVMRTDLESAQDFARTYEALSTGNIETRIQALMSAQHALTEAATPQEKNNAIRNMEKVQKAFDTINEKWQQDPATMAASNQLVSGALKKALTTNDGESMREYIDASVAVQQDNGVANPRILTEAMANGLRASLEAASGNGVEALTTLTQINATYGEHANRVIVEAMGNQRQARVFQQVNMLGEPEMQRTALVAMSRAKDNKAALTPAQRDKMEQIQSKVRAQWTKSMVQESDTTNDAIAEMAGALYAHGISTGKDINPEQVLIGNRFSMTEINGKTLRIPVAYKDWKVEQGVDVATEWLAGSFDSGKFTISNTDPETFFQEGRTSIASVASNDGSGFYLVSQSGNPIINQQGQPLKMSWDEAMDLQKEVLALRTGGPNNALRRKASAERVKKIMEKALGATDAAN
jgi:hypothetical protein